MPTLKLSDYHVIVFTIAPVFRKCKGFPELFVLFFIKYGIKTGRTGHGTFLTRL